MGDALAGNVIGRAMRRRHQRETRSRRAASRLLEADELHRDLTLIVIHRQHAVELALAGAHEHRVGWKRPVADDPLALAARTTGSSTSISSRPKLPPSPHAD